jgi:hypothetical protein
MPSAKAEREAAGAPAFFKGGFAALAAFDPAVIG